MNSSAIRATEDAPRRRFAAARAESESTERTPPIRQKGLFVNSRNLSVKAKRNRALVNAKGQNGRKSLRKPLLRAQCGKAKRKRHAKHRRARTARAEAGGGR